LLVAVGTCLGSYLWVVALLEWDNPDRTRRDRDRDILRGPFDDRR
jgi:hypothetical protein